MATGDHVCCSLAGRHIEQMHYYSQPFKDSYLREKLINDIKNSSRVFEQLIYPEVRGEYETWKVISVDDVISVIRGTNEL